MSNPLFLTRARDFLKLISLRKEPTDNDRAGFRKQVAQKGIVAAGKGEVGELIDSKIVVGSAVALTTATAKNVTSVTLTPGAWLVHGHVNLTATGATRTAASAGISATADTRPTDGSEVASGMQTTTTTHKDGITLTPQVIHVGKAATKVIYLVASTTFSAGTVAAYGELSALRIY